MKYEKCDDYRYFPNRNNAFERYDDASCFTGYAFYMFDVDEYGDEWAIWTTGDGKMCFSSVDNVEM